MHISSVFFAVFDEEQGRQIVYQVPENLITTPPERTRAETPNSIGPHLPTTTAVDQRAAGNDALPRGMTNGTGSSERIGSKSSLSKSTASRVSNGNTNSISPNRPTNAGAATTQTAALFEWQLVAQFVIPPEEMCGRLTISTTKKHRIVGFPVYIRDKKYERGTDERGKHERGKHERGTFQFNVCFVFSKDMDYGKETGISCYEPVVRKLARILTACEIEQSLLSSEETQPRMYPILEQLFADLNAFSETSIRIDKYNSIELRIFPHYPNPPPVNTWDVPVPLIDISNRMEANWDLTMRKIVPFINGVDHVKKIAQKAESDIALVRECMSQVMMYQCVMMIDIFQFSNIYTLCRPTMWLFTDRAVYEECGPYVHKGPGLPLPWPRLAWYYARLKPPLTVGGWISEYDVDLETIDVRRFISFGVIKGFLRRVHRWPILLKDDKLPLPPSVSKRRNKSINLAAGAPPPHGTKQAIEKEVGLQMGNFSANPDLPPGLGSAATIVGDTRKSADNIPAARPIPTTSALPNDTVRPITGIGSYFGPSSIPRDPPDKEGRAAKQTSAAVPVQTSSSYVPQSVLKSRLGTGMLSYDSTGNEEEDPQAVSLPIAQELASQAYTQGQAVAKLKGVAASGGMAVEVPPELSELLDGTHHSDELCVHFGQSWNVLRATLGVIGGGTGDDGDLGRVVILYR